jgi:hypothetical protein
LKDKASVITSTSTQPQETEPDRPGCTGSAPVIAQEIMGPYIGGNIGRSRADFDIPANLNGIATTLASVSSALSTAAMTRRKDIRRIPLPPQFRDRRWIL